MKLDEVLRIMEGIKFGNRTRFNYSVQETANEGGYDEDLYVQVKINTGKTKATLEAFDINDDFINSIKLLLNDNTCSNMQPC